MCGGPLYRVNGAEEAIDFLGVVVAFEGDEAIAYDLQVFFGFRLEEFEDFGTYFVVRGQRIEIRTCESGLRDLVGCWSYCRPLIESQRNWLDRESEAVALFEGGDVFNVFLAGVADFQQIGFQQGDTIGQEFS